MSVKIIFLIVLMSVIAGCAGKSEPASPATVPVPVPTPAPTTLPTPVLTAQPTSTPEPLRTFFDEADAENYVFVPASKIYSGSMDGKFVRLYGKVFNVLPKLAITDNDGTQFDMIKFQVWGNVLSYGDPLFIKSIPAGVHGTIRDGVMVEIRGYVSTDWASGENSYGGSVTQPLIYAHNVTVIPERAPD